MKGKHDQNNKVGKSELQSYYVDFSSFHNDTYEDYRRWAGSRIVRNPHQVELGIDDVVQGVYIEFYRTNRWGTYESRQEAMAALKGKLKQFLSKKTNEPRNRVSRNADRITCSHGNHPALCSSCSSLDSMDYGGEKFQDRDVLDELHKCVDDKGSDIAKRAQYIR